MKFIYTLIFSILYISIFSQTIDTCKISIGENLTVCLNSKVGIEYSSPLKNPIITWSGTATFACNSCPKFFPKTILAGTFPIYINAKSGACNVSDTLNMTVLPVLAPKATFVKAATICANQKISIGNGANDANLTYKWGSLPVGYTSDANNPNVSPSQSTTYFVAVTNNGCPLPLLDTVKITAFDFTNIGLPKGDTTVCKGKSFVLCKDIMKVGATYTWSPATYCSNVKDLNATFTPTSNITYQLEVKAGLCKVGYTVPVKVAELNIELSLSDTVKVCQNAPITLLISKSVGIGTLNWYQNDVKQNQYENFGSVKFSPNQDTKYTVVFQNGGCIAKDSIFAKVYDNLKNMTLPVDSVICKGQLLEFSPKSNGKSINDIINIMWSVSPALSFLSFKDTFYCKPDTSLLIKVSVKTAFCEGTVSKFVTVKSKGDLKLKTSKKAICEGEEIEIETFSSFPSLLTWFPAVNCADKNCTKTKVSPTKDIKYSVFSQGLCAAKDSVEIKVSKNLDGFTLGGDSTICKGTKAKVFVNGANPNSNFTYQWSVVPKIPFTSNKDTLFCTSDTSFVATLFLKNDVCEKTITKNISIKKGASASINASKSTICEGEITELSVEGNFNSKIEWEQTVGCLDNNCTKVKVSPVKDKVYSFKSNSNAECEISGSIQIKVNAAPTITQAPQTNFCIGEKLDSIALNIAPDASILYTWQSADDALFQTTNLAAPKIKPYKSAVYTVKMKKGECEANAEVVVKVATNGFIKLMKDTLVCLGEPVKLTFSSSLKSNEISNFKWISGGSVSEITINPVLPKSIYSFEMNYTLDGVSCFFKDSVKVLLKPSPTGEISIDPNFNFAIDTFVKGKIFKFSFDDKNNLKIKDYIWSYNDKTDDFKNKAITKAIIESTIVKLKVTAENGCMATFETPQFVPKEIKVVFPKVFTPNTTDGNEIFALYVLAGNEEYISLENLTVFNRWGEKVFYYKKGTTSSTESTKWNGKKNNDGEDLPTDVYIYNYQTRDKSNKLMSGSGEIMLLR